MFLTNRFAYLLTCSLGRFWHNVEGPRLIFLLCHSKSVLSTLPTFKPQSIVLKYWDVMSTLHAYRRRILGREDRCRCHEVALVVSWMAEELRVVPKRIATLRCGDAKTRL